MTAAFLREPGNQWLLNLQIHECVCVSARGCVRDSKKSVVRSFMRVPYPLLRKQHSSGDNGASHSLTHEGTLHHNAHTAIKIQRLALFIAQTALRWCHLVLRDITLESSAAWLQLKPAQT